MPTSPDRRESGAVQRVRASWHGCPFTRASTRVIIACSGGPDSLALTMLIAPLARQHLLEPTVVHIDHRVRPGSERDADTVAAAARSLGMPFVSRRLSERAGQRHPGVGPEECLRRERYRVLAEVAAGLGAPTIVLGHHLDDQAETVLLHMFRGSGMRGLTGMREWSRVVVPWWDPSGSTVHLAVWRPLLGVRRSELRQLVNQLGLEPVDDPSNAEPRFRRNAVRHTILPAIESAFPEAARTIANLASTLQSDVSALDWLVEREVPRDGNALERVTFRRFPPEVQRQVVRRWIRRALPGLEVSAERTDAVARAVAQQGSGARIELGSGHEIRILRTDAIIAERADANEGDQVDSCRAGEKNRVTNRVPDDAKSSGVASVLINQDQIRAKVAELAAELDDEYANDRPLLVCVLRGAITFMSDLTKEMSIPLEMDFMAISSYGASTRSSGVVRILKDLDEDIEGRRIIVVEDIVDSGLTLQYLLGHLQARHPRDIRVVALVKKDKPDAIDVQVDRVGFRVPDEFVVGYGLDFAGRYRNLPYVGVLHPSVYEASDPVDDLADVPHSVT